MAGEDTGASVRQFVRHETRVSARMEIHPEDVEQFRLSFPDAASGLAVVDVSEGGLGLQSDFFIPRNMRLALHVNLGEPEQDSPARDLKIQAACRRCTMLDHKPTYLIGMQFLDPSGGDEQTLLRSVQAEGGRSDRDT